MHVHARTTATTRVHFYARVYAPLAIYPVTVSCPLRLCFSVKLNDKCYYLTRCRSRINLLGRLEQRSGERKSYRIKNFVKRGIDNVRRRRKFGQYLGARKSRTSTGGNEGATWIRQLSKSRGGEDRVAIYAVRERASRESLEGGKRGFGRQANGFGCGMEARQWRGER